MHGIDLHWLPTNTQWTAQLASAAGSADTSLEAWYAFVALARTRLSSIQTIQLDRRRARELPSIPPGLVEKPIRLAVLAASTIEHLLPAIRVGGIRRSIWIDTYTPDYGQYTQELINPSSGLHRFSPTTVLFALNGYHLMQGIEPGATADSVTSHLGRLLDRLEAQWDTARSSFSAQILQNVPLPVFLPLVGSNEQRLPGSRLAALHRQLLMTSKAGIQ